MQINKLKEELEQAIDDFSSEIRMEYRDGSQNVVTEHDINELARQTFYTLDKFKDSIIKYLSEQ